MRCGLCLCLSLSLGVQFLSSAKTLLKSMRALRPLERQLSEQLGGVVIERPPHVPSKVYRRWLEEFCVECKGRLDAVLSSVMLETKLVLTGYVCFCMDDAGRLRLIITDVSVSQVEREASIPY